MGEPTTERRWRWNRLYGVALGAGFIGAWLFIAAGLMPYLFWLGLPLGLALMAIFMIAMGRAAREP